MPLVYPLVAWGSADDISASPWIDANIPTVTGSQADPFGGTSAYKIDDNDALSAEARLSGSVASAGTTQMAAVFVKADTAVASDVVLWDETASLTRHRVRLTWSGGVPTATTGAGAGTILTLDVGASWYLIIWSATGCVSGNSHRLRLYGATITVADNGATIYYVRNVAALGLVDNVIAWDQPAAGYATARNSAGTEDAWVTATDYMVGLDVRWVGQSPADVPIEVSGWEGLNEVPGINCGVGAMLRAGRDKEDLLWVPDRSDCSSYITSKLAEPLQGPPSLEQDGRRRQRIVLRNTTTEFAGYA